MFVGETVSWTCKAAGRLELGVVDAALPGVAEGISRLLVRSIQDARSDAGGHLPGWLVDDIERNYISPEKVRTLWAKAGRRFAVVAGREIIGTVHVARRHDVILTADRTRNNVPAAELPGLKPHRHHQVVNVSVLHELRRAGIAARMFDAITTSFRHLFDGDGLWVRADPPWHPWLARLGFEHDPSFDVFLPETAERTSGLPHRVFNLLHACACAGARETDEKLQYVSFTRPFDRPSSAEELARIVARASVEGRRIGVRGARSGPPPREIADVVVSTHALDALTVYDDRVSAGAGVTWRALMAVLPKGRLPPVVPGYVDATIGGSLSTGGIGKGSVEAGLAVDHVDELVVVTREGRVALCSRTKDAWLFEAMLGSQGAFGIIAQATIPLVSRRPRVLVDKRIVARDELASALDVRALHAFATKTSEGWLAIVARETDDPAGVPLETFVAPPRRTGDGARIVQTFIEPERLSRFLAEREGERVDELAVHPIRRPASLVYAVTVTP